MKNRTTTRGRTTALTALTATLGVIAVSVLTGLPAVAAPTEDPSAPGDTPIAAAENLQIVDPGASATTLSLFLPSAPTARPAWRTSVASTSTSTRASTCSTTSRCADLC